MLGSSLQNARRFSSYSLGPVACDSTTQAQRSWSGVGEAWAPSPVVLALLCALVGACGGADKKPALAPAEDASTDAGVPSDAGGESDSGPVESDAGSVPLADPAVRPSINAVLDIE